MTVEPPPECRDATSAPPLEDLSGLACRCPGEIFGKPGPGRKSLKIKINWLEKRLVGNEGPSTFTLVWG